MMKYLVVNADDFGASRGINRGIIEAHRRGILTSTSLLVNTPWSEEAVEASRAAPQLSVGLHIDAGQPRAEFSAGSPRVLREVLREQLSHFERILGRPPTHLDSHHNIHRDPRWRPHFLALAAEYRLPLREHSAVRYFSKFYGQWGGETHFEQISVESLARMLEKEIQPGVTELSCHPGYTDPDYITGYAAEREIELRTLGDRRVRQVFAEQSIRLISYHDVARLQLSAGT